MPGLQIRSTWEPLLLKASSIRSSTNGCTLNINAHLSYVNVEAEPVEGVFVYPLGEKEVLVGFEAVMGKRMVTVQLQNQARLEDCCLDCYHSSTLDSQCVSGKQWDCCSGSARDMQCTNGHLILDEDLERSTFVVNVGIVGPSENASVLISTTTELQTTESGAIHLVYPSVLMPVVRARAAMARSESGGKVEENGPTSCFGASGKQQRPVELPQPCLHAAFSSPTISLAPYDLAFHLLVRGACLLAGIESPTHALRADADPGACSANATNVTLAEEHPYDRHLEIILHLSEAHRPLVIVERGRLTFDEYQRQVCARRDFMRCVRKGGEPEKHLEFVRRRFHKDVPFNPVLMLNFCPELRSITPEPCCSSRELLFLLDRSGSMSGNNIQRLKEGMLLALKSLPPGTLLNIVGFGSTINTLFPSSKPCTNDSVVMACDYVQRMRADLGSTNLLGALCWVYEQPALRSCPRQVLLITDGSVSNVGRVLQLVRRHATAARCFTLGLGPLVCRRLLGGMAAVSGGTAAFLTAEERLQPQLVRTLKKAFEPALTDVRVDWYVPERMEALLSPSEIPPLYPGSCLIAYCILYDMSSFQRAMTQGHLGRAATQTPGQLQDTKTGPHRHVSQMVSSELSGIEATPLSQLPSGSLPQGLERVAPPKDRGLTRWESLWLQGVGPAQEVEPNWKRPESMVRSTLCSRSFSSPQGELDMQRLQRELERLEERDGEVEVSRRSLNDSTSLLFPISPLDWDNYPDPAYLFSAAPPEDPQVPPAHCRSVIHASLDGRPLTWEVTVDLSALWALAEEEGEEILHQLAARSLIHDYEKEAEKEPDAEHGPAKRSRVKAIQTSRSCKVTSVYTTFASVDGDGSVPRQSSGGKSEPLRTQNGTAVTFDLTTESGTRPGLRQRSHSGSKKMRMLPLRLGRSSSSRGSEEDSLTPTDRDDAPASPCSLTSWDSSTGGSWNPTSPSSLSTRSQRAADNWSVENFFGSRFPISRFKGMEQPGKPVPLKPHCLSVEMEKQNEDESIDYLPLVHLQQASGAFLLTDLFSESMGIPLERLKRASPYSLHRSSLSPTSRCGSSYPTPPQDSGRGSPLEPLDDLQSSSWATAVALAWLEHRCAGFFPEWELVAAKADRWLRGQRLPEGQDVCGLKGAARHLFLLLRHWDENIKLNMLCYNPNNM